MEIKSYRDGSVLFSAPVKSNKNLFALAARNKIDLSFAQLRNLNLSGINLEKINLSNAEILGCSFSQCELYEACFKNAFIDKCDFSFSDLRFCDFSSAQLIHTAFYSTNSISLNFNRAMLDHVDFSKAYFDLADFSYTDLSTCNLMNTCLSGAKIYKAYYADKIIVPACGSFIGWKKGRFDKIIKLKIPSWSRRTSCITGRKCRAEIVYVLEITQNGKQCNSAESLHRWDFRYIVNTFTKADSFNSDNRIECSNGIHFFITREEAENWN